MKYWHCMWQASEIRFQAFKCFKMFLAFSHNFFNYFFPLALKWTGWARDQTLTVCSTFWSTALRIMCSLKTNLQFNNAMWFKCVLQKQSACILQFGCEEGGLDGLLLENWRSAARCLLHHRSWHMAPGLTTARFHDSTSTAGTVHPPDPASSSQNKPGFVPPRPNWQGLGVYMLSKKKKSRVPTPLCLPVLNPPPH